MVRFPFNSVKQLQEQLLSNAFPSFLNTPLSGQFKALQLCLPALKLPGGNPCLRRFQTIGLALPLK